MPTTESANLDTVRAIYAAFARGDIATVLAAMDPEVAWLTPATLPWSAGDYSGRTGVAKYFADSAGALTNAAVVPQEFLDAADHVVVHGEARGTATETGRAFAARFTHTWTLRGGKVTRMRGVVDTAAIRDCFSAEAAPPPALPTGGRA